MEKNNKTTIYMGLRMEKHLGRSLIRYLETRRMGITAALAAGLEMWLEAEGATELAAMVGDGRGIVPRKAERHKDEYWDKLFGKLEKGW